MGNCFYYKKKATSTVKGYSPIKAVLAAGDHWRHHAAVRDVDLFTSIALRDPTIDAAEYSLMTLFERGQLSRIS
jgi:hypothetical protein